MIRWLWFIFLWTGACLLGLLLDQDSGYIFIRWHRWTLEMTCWTGLCTLMITYLALRISLSCVSWLIHTTQSLYHQYQTNHATQKMAQDISPEGYWILGQLFEQMKEKTKATRAYREGLTRWLASRRH